MTVTLNMTAAELRQILSVLSKMQIEQKDRIVFNKLMATIKREVLMWGFTENKP